LIYGFISAKKMRTHLLIIQRSGNALKIPAYPARDCF